MIQETLVKRKSIFKWPGTSWHRLISLPRIPLKGAAGHRIAPELNINLESRWHAPDNILFHRPGRTPQASLGIASASNHLKQFLVMIFPGTEVPKCDCMDVAESSSPSLWWRLSPTTNVSRCLVCIPAQTSIPPNPPIVAQPRQRFSFGHLDRGAPSDQRNQLHVERVDGATPPTDWKVARSPASAAATHGADAPVRGRD